MGRAQRGLTIATQDGVIVLQFLLVALFLNQGAQNPLWYRVHLLFCGSFQVQSYFSGVFVISTGVPFKCCCMPIPPNGNM